MGQSNGQGAGRLDPLTAPTCCISNALTNRDIGAMQGGEGALKVGGLAARHQFSR